MLDTGECIYLWRLKRGMGQEELARKSGIPQPNLSNLERGKADITVGTLRKIAFALGAAVGDLAEGRPPQQSGSLPTTRRSLEKIARAVFDPAAPLTAGEKEVAACLRILRPPKKSPSVSKKRLHSAWMTLRLQFSAGELNALLGRVADQERRLT